MYICSQIKYEKKGKNQNKIKIKIAYLIPGVNQAVAS